jgi:hypothetical protein
VQSLTVGAASGVDQSDESKTFEEVMEALERYTNVTGEPPLMLSG